MKCSLDSTAQMLALEALRSGTVASLAMMPFGLLFKLMGLRVGHYGPKVGEALFGHQPDPWTPVLLLLQHFVIGWLSALPLLIFWLWRAPRAIWLGNGLLYGLAYYFVVNAVTLPWLFGDAFPWQLGWSTIYPSLVVHLVFGVSIALTVRMSGFPRFIGGYEKPARLVFFIKRRENNKF